MVFLLSTDQSYSSSGESGRAGYLLAHVLVGEPASASPGHALGVGMLRRDTIGRRGVLGRIHVEERVDRRFRPVREGDPVAAGPDLDLVQVLVDERAAQFGPQRDRPQP